MARANLCSKSVPRVELDHRARDARLRLVRIERLLVPRAAVKGLWLLRVARVIGFRLNGAGREGNPTRGSLSDRQRCCMPEIDSVWPEADGTFSPV